jgi:hypothetical protein
MLKEISAAIKKLLTSFVFFSGSPTMRGEEAAASRQIQHSISVIHPKIFLRVTQARFSGFCPDIAAARKKEGVISASLRLRNAGSNAYTSRGSGNRKNIHL